MAFGPSDRFEVIELVGLEEHEKGRETKEDAGIYVYIRTPCTCIYTLYMYVHCTRLNVKLKTTTHVCTSMCMNDHPYVYTYCRTLQCQRERNNM